jgi:hypothetical protein
MAGIRTASWSWQDSRPRDGDVLYRQLGPEDDLGHQNQKNDMLHIRPDRWNELMPFYGPRHGAGMKLVVFFAFVWLALGNAAMAQETVYPVPPKSDVPALMTQDRSGFVIEKTFEYKITVGRPANQQAWFLPNSKVRLVVLWMRIENLSQQPLELNTAKFTSTDDEGHTYTPLIPDDVFHRIAENTGGDEPTLASKTIKGISLGRAGNKVTEDQLREDFQRYSLLSGPISAHSTRDGLIYFEAPKKKKFVVNVVLVGLWSKPFTFSTSKPK